MKSRKHSFPEFAFIDDADGNVVEVPVTVSLSFTPQDGTDAPEIEDFRVRAKRSAMELARAHQFIPDLAECEIDVTADLHKEELDRLVNLAWENVGVERPMLDLTEYRR